MTSTLYLDSSLRVTLSVTKNLRSPQNGWLRMIWYFMV
jgi:hypothetical protein